MVFYYTPDPQPLGKNYTEITLKRSNGYKDAIILPETSYTEYRIQETSFILQHIT